MNALIVDDSAAMRRIEQRALEAAGWSVRTAVNGKDALTVLASLASCDLVLTDWHMPEMDGLDLVRAIRAETRFDAVRIVMVTSESVMDAVESALRAGANDFVMKPFSADALAARIAEAMSG